MTNSSDHQAEKAHTGIDYCACDLDIACPVHRTETAQSGVVILTRYETKVHASNRNSDFGVPVVVFAESRRQAVDRAIAVGWAGETRDARVTLLNIEQVPVVVPPGPTGPEAGR